MTGPLAWAPVVAFIVAVVVTKGAELIGRRRGLLDVPGARSSHATPTPRIGGTGIVTATIVGWIVFGGWRDPDSVVIVAAAGLLGLVGLADDLGFSSTAGKYLAQLAAAAAVAIALEPALRIDAFGWRLEVEGAVAIVLSTVWLTAITNAFNFLDGIDGMLGALSLVISLFGIGLVAADAAPTLVIVAAAALGFLVWNRPPASVFMGDVGSQFLGLVVGATLLVQPQGIVDVVPVLILYGLVLFDTGLTLLRRMREGKNLFVAHREHLYQRLAPARESHGRVSLLYAALTVALGLVALMWLTQPAEIQVVVAVALMAAAFALVLIVRRVEETA